MSSPNAKAKRTAKKKGKKTKKSKKVNIELEPTGSPAKPRLLAMKTIEVLIAGGSKTGKTSILRKFFDYD